MAKVQLVARDGTDSFDSESHWGPSTFAFLAILVFTCCVASTLLYLRRCRRIALQQQGLLPRHHQPGHRRTLTIATTSAAPSHRDAVLIYDEKMNLLASAPHSPNGTVPEIRVTFPDEDDHTGQQSAGRVVVLRIADSGSVGMEPLHKDNTLPPYQRSDAERFQSLDLERMGGLREKAEVQPRYS